MIDPGAIGTQMIGQRAADAELAAEFDPARWPRGDEEGPPPSRRSARAALAQALRVLADRVEPATTGLESTC